MPLKIALLTIALVLSACGTPLPEPPEVWQCGYSVKFNKFRCVNTRTKEKINVSRDSAQMEGAQCLPAGDYAKSERWVDELIRIARQRCK